MIILKNCRTLQKWTHCSCMSWCAGSCFFKDSCPTVALYQPKLTAKQLMAKRSWNKSLHEPRETKPTGGDICSAARTSSHPQADLAAMEIKCERGDSQIKLSSVKQKLVTLSAFTNASMSPYLKLQKFSYLKGSVVVCYVGVVVPGGGLGKEHRLLCSAVVVEKKFLCIWHRVCVVWRLPFFS